MFFSPVTPNAPWLLNSASNTSVPVLKTEKVDSATVSFPSQLKARKGPGNEQKQTLPHLCTFYTKMSTTPVSFREV